MFVDGANGVSVSEGDNMPFTRVSWGLLQSAVLSDGATFMVQRAAIGANQEMEPSGDVAYVTCGPFECVDGMDKAELSILNSGVCTAWDPDMVLQYGMVDNDVLGGTIAVVDGDGVVDISTSNDGLDIGWVSSSSVGMSVMHHFAGVEDGNNYSASGRDAVTGSNEPVPMDLGDGLANDADKDAGTSNADYLDALIVEGCESSYVPSVTAGARGVDQPDECFRIIADPDYLSGYSVEVSATGSAVTWGNVDWEEDPFEKLTCDSKTFVAAEQVDVCALFEDEAAQAFAKGWGDVVIDLEDNPDNPGTESADSVAVQLWKVSPKSASSERFKTLWFDDNLDEKLPKKGTSAFKYGLKGLNDLYDAHGNEANIKGIWQSVLDKDDDLMRGDFGKVDLVSDKDSNATADDETTLRVEGCPTDEAWSLIVDDTADDTVNPTKFACHAADADDITSDDTTTTAIAENDGYGREDKTGTKAWPDGKADNILTTSTQSDVRECSEGDGGEEADGTVCDGDWSETFDVLLAAGVYGCTTTQTVTISCEWDASGELNGTRRHGDPGFSPATDGDFAKCTAK